LGFEFTGKRTICRALEAPLSIARSFNCGEAVWNSVRPDGTVESMLKIRLVVVGGRLV
jgi:hypothetical protein